ncbi:MAG: protoheme IX farnesyltransferase [Rhodospirillaceae bacterium]|nr:protoheme IX farnesyltransferase [Rhodospirillaceae bacterium]
MAEQLTETSGLDDVAENTDPVPGEVNPRVVDYAILLKPRVMSLVLFTGIVGIVMAPGSIDWLTAVIAVICIGVGAGASGAINMWYDRDIDSQMERTMDRPIPAGRMSPGNALWFGVVLSVLSVAAMAVWVNTMSAALLAGTIIYYVFIYTVWLKRRTPQNIVIGGGSGALPPIIGWAAVTGDVTFNSFLLFAIIFMWTPPHFWALALFRSGDYEKAGVPMMPIVSGVTETKKQMLIYTILLLPITVAPAFTGLISIPAGVIIGALGLWFIRHAVVVMKSEGFDAPRSMFKFSILHLFLIFVILLADRGVQSLL